MTTEEAREREAKYFVRAHPEAPERGPYSVASIGESLKANRLEKTSLARCEGNDELVSVEALLAASRGSTAAARTSSHDEVSLKDVAGFRTGPLYAWGPTIVIALGVMSCAAIWWLHVEASGSFVPPIIVVPTLAGWAAIWRFLSGRRSR